MARKLEVEILATTLGYTRSLTKAAEQTKTFARTVDDSSKHIGRSLAFATGGFVAFAGASEFLRTSIDAARDAGVAQRQLGAQMKASGQSFQASKGAIDKAGLSLERFGFTSEDSAKALTVLERGTGSITRSIELQGVAANLARAKNIGLSDAATVLAKVFGGQETALRRAVPGLEKHAHGLDLIREAQQKLAGQAAAGTTVAERFSATLHDTEVIVGNALLPTLDKLLTSLGNWLTKMNESGRLQRDMNTAVKDGTQLFEALVPWVDAAKSAFKDLSDAVGGTKNALELLIGVLAAWKLTSLISNVGLLSTGVRNVGTNAETSSGKVTGLRGNLSKLSAMQIVVPVILAEAVIHSNAYKSTIGWVTSRTGDLGKLLLGNVGDVAGVEARAVGNVLSYLGLTGGSKPGGLQGPVGTRFRPGAGTLGPIGVPGGANGPAAARRQNYTPEEKLLIALSRSPNNIGLLRQQAAYDQHQVAFLNRLQASGKGPGPAAIASEIEGFNSDRSSRLSTIAGIQSAAASQSAAARKKAADAAKKAAAEAKQDAVEARKMIARLIGRQHESPEQYVARAEKPGAYERLGPLMAAGYNVPHALQLALVREQALGKSQTQTLKAARAAAWKALRSGKLSGRRRSTRTTRSPR